MKRKIIIMLIAVFTVMTSTAYAISPTYNQEDNYVSFEFGENGYKTVLITEKNTEDIFYIGQNSSGYMGARAFLIKNHPKDGNYVLRAGGLGGEPLTEEFSIFTYNAVQAVIDTHISEIYLVNGEDRYKGTIADGKATFLVPDGTYTVEVTCDTGYRVKGTVNNITVTKGETQSVNIETETDQTVKYKVTGTVDEGVKSVTISNDGMEPITITEFTDNAFSCELSAGEYTVTAEANDEYTIVSNLPQSITVTISEEAQAMINISTTQKHYTIEVTKGENVKSVTLLDSENNSVTGTTDGNKITYSVTAGTYTVTAETENGYVLDEYTAELTVNKDDTFASVNITAHLSEQPKYNVSGTVDQHVDSLIIKQGGKIVAAISEFENGVFSCELESGEYTIKIVPEAGYEVDGETDEISVTVTNEGVENISITTREIPATEPATSTEISDEENDKIVLTTKITNVADENSIIAAAYDTNGTLISVKLSNKNDDEISFEFRKDVNIKTFKILVWSSVEEMKPITKGEEKTYN